MELSDIFEPDVLEHLTRELTAQHGKGLDNKILNALRHIERTYSQEAKEDMWDNGDFSSVKKINDFIAEGEQSHINFPSMAGEVDKPVQNDESDYRGLPFPSMDEDAS